MKITILIRPTKEDTTPEQCEKTQGFTPGYAKRVREVIKAAKKIDRKSIWGWCNVEVVATIDTTATTNDDGLITTSNKHEAVGTDDLGDQACYTE